MHNESIFSTNSKAVYGRRDGYFNMLKHALHAEGLGLIFDTAQRLTSEDRIEITPWKVTDVAIKPII